MADPAPITWTEAAYEDHANRIATAIWETTTGNGQEVPEIDHDSHMQNCHAAAANTWCEGISVEAWHAAALRRMTG